LRVDTRIGKCIHVEAQEEVATQAASGKVEQEEVLS
jgi:hypothetical protein